MRVVREGVSARRAGIYAWIGGTVMLLAIFPRLATAGPTFVSFAVNLAVGLCSLPAVYLAIRFRRRLHGAVDALVLGCVATLVAVAAAASVALWVLGWPELPDPGSP